MTKSDLRKAYLERRRSLSPTDHSAFSRAIADHLLAEVNFGAIGTLSCFISLKHFGEVETALIFNRVWEKHPQIITTAPKINDATGEIDSFVYQDDTPVSENRWRIPEPDGVEIVEPGSLDLIIIPLLCFDLRGHRVGYGKGFYDRYLQKCRPDCIKAGLSFFPPVESIDDVNSDDIPLDVCVMPSGTHHFSSLT